MADSGFNFFNFVSPPGRMVHASDRRRLEIEEPSRASPQFDLRPPPLAGQGGDQGGGGRSPKEAHRSPSGGAIAQLAVPPPPTLQSSPAMAATSATAATSSPDGVKDGASAGSPTKEVALWYYQELTARALGKVLPLA